MKALKETPLNAKVCISSAQPIYIAIIFAKEAIRQATQKQWSPLDSQMKLTSFKCRCPKWCVRVMMIWSYELTWENVFNNEELPLRCWSTGFCKETSLSSELSLNVLQFLFLIKLSFLWIWSQSHWNGYQAVTIAKSNSTRQVFNLALLLLPMLCPSFLSVKILVWIS